jgi:hypothetical protein
MGIKGGEIFAIHNNHQVTIKNQNNTYTPVFNIAKENEKLQYSGTLPDEIAKLEGNIVEGFEGFLPDKGNLMLELMSRQIMEI